MRSEAAPLTSFWPSSQNGQNQLSEIGSNCALEVWEGVGGEEELHYSKKDCWPRNRLNDGDQSVSPFLRFDQPKSDQRRDYDQGCEDRPVKAKGVNMRKGLLRETWEFTSGENLLRKILCVQFAKYLAH